MTKSLNNGHRAVQHYLQHYNTTHMNEKETSDRYSSEKAVVSDSERNLTSMITESTSVSYRFKCKLHLK